MNRLELHLKAVAVLEMIDRCYVHIESYKESKDIIHFDFLDLRTHYERRIITTRHVIERLEKYYLNLLKKLI